MFWKRKRNDSEMFSYKTDDRRTFFRVCPSEEEPMVFQFGEKKVRVINISAGGLSFNNNDFSVKETHPVDFDLPGQDSKISTVLEIVGIDQKNICHCRFKGIEEDAVEEIHQYVLIRQKVIMRTKRKRSKQKEGQDVQE